jgi:phage terminase large subunit-like protein
MSLADLDADDAILAEVSDAIRSQSADPRLAWLKQARPEQRLPEGDDWRICYWRGGRGSGKNRSGAGGLADWILGDTDGEGEYGIIAPTYADAWTKCVEGESGLLKALGTSMSEVKDHRSATVRSAWRTYGQVVLHNGITVYIDSAAEGGLRIQGRNLKGAWCDEIGLWDKWEISWNESLKYAVREGRAQIICTGTPKASRSARRLVRSLLRNDPEHGGVVNRRLRTIDNVANLSPTFQRAVIAAAQGTRLEKQELEGELLDDVANALWTRELLESIRVPGIGQEGAPGWLRQVCIGVDPSDGSETSDEQAYTISGLGPVDEGLIYVAESWGGQLSPVPFAKLVIRKALAWNATVVVEKNHGGKWLESTFRLVMREMGVKVKLKVVHASDAKRTRAEPVSALYEEYGGRVRHCHKTWSETEPVNGVVPVYRDEHMPELEDQMATFTGARGERSPDRLDSLVWSLWSYLKMNLGIPPGKGGPHPWAVAKELELAGAPADPVNRKRLASAHGGLMGRADQWGLDSFGPAEDWDLDHNHPKTSGHPADDGPATGHNGDDPEAAVPPARGNVYGWGGGKLNG